MKTSKKEYTISDLHRDHPHLPSNILQQLRYKNPYTEDVFLPRKRLDWVKLNMAAKAYGLTLDGFMGSEARRVWNLCCDELEALIAEERFSNGLKKMKIIGVKRK